MSQNHRENFKTSLIISQICSINRIFIFLPLPIMFILTFLNPKNVMNKENLLEYSIYVFVIFLIPLFVTILMVINIIKSFLNIIWLFIFGKNKIEEKNFEILNREIVLSGGSDNDSTDYKMKVKYNIVKHGKNIKKIKKFKVSKKYFNDASYNFVLLQYGFWKSVKFKSKKDKNIDDLIGFAITLVIFILEIFYFIRPVLNIILKQIK